MAVELIQLGGGSRHQELEQELAIPVTQPLAQPRQPPRLSLVQLGVALGVVPHQDLGERRVERLDVRPEVVAVLELKLLLAGPFDWHRERYALGLRRTGDVGPELLVHQHAARARRCPGCPRLTVSVEDDLLH